MKIVKLNRRFKQFRENGHTVALRFKHYDPRLVGAYEKVCRARLKSHGYNREGDWAGYFGHAPNTSSGRPYWITFRNEADLTLIMLSVTIS